MICIVDLDIGNLANVKRALGGVITDDPASIEEAEKIVLPGVGNFGSAMDNIEPLRETIVESAEDGKPILGICLGMHLLFESSEESKGEGLGILKGDVRKFDEEKAPHIGWNTVELDSRAELFDRIESERYFYFAHSYRAFPEDEGIVVGKTELSCGEKREEFPSVVQKGNIYGTQFHPEKSGEVGLRVLNNFKRDGVI